MGRPRFDAAALAWLREQSIERVLDALGFYWKPDRDFTPEKDRRTVRLLVSSPQGAAWEILVTGVKWFDARAGVGGGGAIDLTMHLLRVDFVDAVSLLFKRVSRSFVK